MQSEKGIQILKDIIDEVCATFDVPYLHIGTDEVQFTNPDFVPMMVKYIRDKGKKVISYNPGWNYKPGEIDMTQLWSYRERHRRASLPSTAATTTPTISIPTPTWWRCSTAASITRQREVMIWLVAS